MVRKILTGLFILLVLVVVGGFIVFRYYITENVIIDFIKKNPDRSAIYWTHNGKIMADLRSNTKFPLASTVKIIIAIEFAKQVAAQKINPKEQIPISDLDIFYLPNTDGGAHKKWKELMAKSNLIQNNAVSLEEVAKGMIRFSSNANTEYLMMKLGLDNINANLDSLGLKQHDRLYPIVSALLVFSNDKGVQKDSFLAQIKNLSTSDYTQKCFEFHEKLKKDIDGSLKKAFVFPDMDLQKIWSDRLPAATTYEYVSIMQKINNRTYFSATAQKQLDTLMEWVFEVNPKNREIYEHIGMKGGSTAFVLTNSLYAISSYSKDEIAYFFNNLTSDETMILQMSMNTFHVSCLKSSTFEDTSKKLKEL
jgi:D-alanyl-D-alanine carboxypeptidase